MTMIDNGRRIRCDGNGCRKIGLAPVSLRHTLPSDQLEPAAIGWLVVVDNDVTLHYCPACATRERKQMGADGSDLEQAN